MKDTFLFFISCFFLLLISACKDQGDLISPDPIIPSPALTSVTPDSGFVDDTVKIIGTNFGSSQGSSSVKFGTFSGIVIANGWTATEIKVKIPVGAITDSISIIANGKTSNKKRFKLLVASTAPNIISISPDSGKVGDTISVAGTNFGTTQSSSTVSIAGTNAATIISWSAGQIKVVIPIGVSIGNTTIAITVNGQTGNAKFFKVISTVTLISFANDITPLFNSNGCAGCHGGSGGLNVLPYSSLRAGNSNNGPVIIVGDGEGSKIVKKLRGTAGFGSRMPQGSAALSESDIQKFVQWINQGALNN